ncbi:hypothetical protein MRX98_00315 [Desulfatitalea sp. M08but]|uniref:Uncharacterized protein n=1 Tax=Desulfatitalea alkaliphila TaxID=2929485 RepID=A0AA41R435_9BACT|nr:hypothetical protein [Desulfatitalea alkaliphila]MCJ8498998.1 hypothetical protein [Desulfatitalea alkaliphila]
MASATVRPKPSLSDFCSTTSAIRLARVDVAAPYPLAFSSGAQIEQGRRLRIVDEHHIRLGQYIGQSFVVAGVGRFILMQQFIVDLLGHALQAIMKFLRALVECRFSSHDFPSDVDSQLLLQGNQAV